MIFLADRAKQIKTKVTVNEDPTEKLIKDLKEENDRLKAALSGGKFDPKMFSAGKENMSQEGELLSFHFNLTTDECWNKNLTLLKEIDQLKKEWMEEMKVAMTDNEKKIEAMRLSYEEKLKQAEKRKGGESSADKLLKKINEDKKTK